MRRTFNLLICLLISLAVFSQNTINCSFSKLANQPVKLIGYDGFDSYTIDSTQASDKGVFNLSFSKYDYGIGYLISIDKKRRNRQNSWFIFNFHFVQVYQYIYRKSSTFHIVNTYERVCEIVNR
jgi:hypothetical protein